MRDADATRRKILEAARVEFSEFGLAGARVNRIAEASGMNKERIYANYGSKDGLFEAVMSDTLDTHAETIGEWGASADDIVERLHQNHVRSPDLLRLMLWEALQVSSDSVPDEERRREHYRERVRALMEAFGLETEAESAAAMMTLIGLAAWPSVMPQLARMLAPEGQQVAFETAQRELLHSLARAVLSTR